MGESYNRANIIGYVGKKPKITDVKVGKKTLSVANFDVCTSLKVGKAKKERATWHHIEAWGPLAMACAGHIYKGRQVHVEGFLDYQSYTDAAGKEHSVTKIQVLSIIFLGKKGGDDAAV